MHPRACPTNAPLAGCAHRCNTPAPSNRQVDAAGTLLIPTESVTEVYMRVAAKHGVSGLSEQAVLDNFRR